MSEVSDVTVISKRLRGCGDIIKEECRERTRQSLAVMNVMVTIGQTYNSSILCTLHHSAGKRVKLLACIHFDY